MDDNGQRTHRERISDLTLLVARGGEERVFHAEAAISEAPLPGKSSKVTKPGPIVLPRPASSIAATIFMPGIMKSNSEIRPPAAVIRRDQINHWNF